MKTFLLSLILFLTSFLFSQTQEEIKSYFNEIAYSGEFGTGCNCLTKWGTDVKIYLDGYYSTQDLQTVKNTISELNNVLTKIQISIVSEKSKSNSILYFGTYMEFNKKYLSFQDDYSFVDGMAVIYPSITSGLIDNTKILICPNIKGVKRNHVILEEITQSLGLANDSMKYPDSIFYDGDTFITSLSKLDKEVITMLYK
jgi:hypothetical protein